MDLERPAESLDLRPHFSLDASITFLNHGSFGAVPRRLQHYQTDLRTQMEAEPVRFFSRELAILMDRARAELAHFLGARADYLALIPNATTGVNAVLRSLDIQPDDEILITDQGYGACNQAARFVAERAGARLITAKLPLPVDDPEQIVTAILAATSDHTRIALIDHITSSTGMVLPLKDIVDALRERGIETLVDGAHAPGMLPLNLDELDAGYYTGNCHKWLCNPRDAAFLYVRPDLIETVRPTTISHGAALPPGLARFRAEFDWTGTFDPTAILTIPETLKFLRALLPGKIDGIYARNRSLAIYARNLLLDLTNTRPICPDSMIGSLAAIDLPLQGPLPASVMEGDPLSHALFNEEGIQVPIFPLHDPPHRLLRISAALYNRTADFDLLASALENRL